MRPEPPLTGVYHAGTRFWGAAGCRPVARGCRCWCSETPEPALLKLPELPELLKLLELLRLPELLGLLELAPYPNMAKFPLLLLLQLPKVPGALLAAETTGLLKLLGPPDLALKRVFSAATFSKENLVGPSVSPELSGLLPLVGRLGPLLAPELDSVLVAPRAFFAVFLGLVSPRVACCASCRTALANSCVASSCALAI